MLFQVKVAIKPNKSFKSDSLREPLNFTLGRKDITMRKFVKPAVGLLATTAISSVIAQEL